MCWWWYPLGRFHTSLWYIVKVRNLFHWFVWSRVCISFKPRFCLKRFSNCSAIVDKMYDWSLTIECVANRRGDGLNKIVPCWNYRRWWPLQKRWWSSCKLFLAEYTEGDGLNIRDDGLSINMLLIEIQDMMYEGHRLILLSKCLVQVFAFFEGWVYWGWFVSKKENVGGITLII